MSESNDIVRIKHMLGAAAEAVKIAESVRKKYLEIYDRDALALARLFEIIGEAANQISQETRQKYPNILWHQIIGMRNKIIHAYMNVDTKIILETAKNTLPVLIDDLTQILSIEKGE